MVLNAGVASRPVSILRRVSGEIPAACATTNICIGHAAELIQWGKQDVVFAGGGEDLDWTMSNLFDAMGAMSSKYNDTAYNASRPFDKNRDGFVIAGGAGVRPYQQKVPKMDRLKRT